MSFPSWRSRVWAPGRMWFVRPNSGRRNPLNAIAAHTPTSLAGTVGASERNRTGGRMARAKNRQTMNKVARERELRERREKKQERKDEKKRLAALGEAGIVDEDGAEAEDAVEAEGSEETATA